MFRPVRLKSYRKYLVLVFILLVSDLHACLCNPPHKCNLALSTLMTMEVLSIYQGDFLLTKEGGRIPLKEGQAPLSEEEAFLLQQTDKTVYARVLNTDDSRLEGKILKITVDRGSSCSTNMGYGYQYLETGYFKNVRDTLELAFFRCMTHQSSFEKTQVVGFYKLKREQKKQCIENHNSGVNSQTLPLPEDTTQKVEFLHMSHALNQPSSWEERDKLYSEVVQAVYDHLGLNTNSVYDRMYVSLYILADGSVFKAEISNPTPGVNYTRFLRKVKRLRFPQLLFRKDGEPRYYPYLTSVDLINKFP